MYLAQAFRPEDFSFWLMKNLQVEKKKPPSKEVFLFYESCFLDETHITSLPIGRCKQKKTLEEV